MPTLPGLDHATGLYFGFLTLILDGEDEDRLDGPSREIGPPVVASSPVDSAITDVLRDTYGLSTGLQDIVLSQTSGPNAARNTQISQDRVARMYDFSIDERKSSKTSPLIPRPENSNRQSTLTLWLYIVRYSLSVTAQDYRPDIMLSQAFNMAKASVLGVGATFVVRRWVRDRGDPDLAVKTIRRCRREEEHQMLEAVLLEVKALTNPSLTDNEFIVQLESVDWEVREGYQHPLPILITQCADFGDLAGYQMSLLTLRYKTKLDLCLDVALGIRALHSQGYIHGDIKSENVLLFRHPERGLIAKLSDFGFSVSPSRRGDKLQIPGKSFPYNAPEIDGNGTSALFIARELEYADAYSLGMLVWRVMLDGQNPFTASSAKAVRPPLADEIIQRKRSDKLIDEACDTLVVSNNDIDPIVVRGTLEHLLRFRPEHRRLLQAITILAEGSSRTESVTKMSFLKTNYRPHEQNMRPEGVPKRSKNRDHLVCSVMEANTGVNIPVFLSFHPLDQKHSAVQENILLAFEELAKGDSEASIAIRLLLAFVYVLGFGHASGQGDLSRVKQHITDAVLRTAQLLLKNPDEVPKVMYFTFTGALQDLLPLTDATVFFFQVVNVLTEGQELAGMTNWMPVKGGFRRSAISGSPIARRLLQEHLPGAFDRSRELLLEDEYVGLLEGPLRCSPKLEALMENDTTGAFRLLKVAYPDFDMIASGGNTYLHLAAELGYNLIVRDLIFKAPNPDFINLPNYHEETPLFKATKGGHFDICKALLDAGAEVKPNLFHETPLHWISSFQEEDELDFLIREFLALGADISQYAGSVTIPMEDAHAKAGTPLERAVSRNNPAAIKALLKSGNNPDLLVTAKAVHSAATYHFAECLQVLLDAKPTMAHNTMDDRNLLGSAIVGTPKWQWYHWHGLEYRQAAEHTLKILLELKVDVTKVATYLPFGQQFLSQLSAMGAAAVVGADHMIRILASYGAPVEAQVNRSDYGRESPPLYQALSRGYYDAAKSLLEAGADPNVRWLMIGGDTYLHLCAHYHWGLDFVRLLVEEFGADIDIVDEHGRTPLYTALLSQYFPFIDYALEHGACPSGMPEGDTFVYNLFGELLTLGSNISNRQLEYALKLSGGAFKVSIADHFYVSALHVVCAPYTLSNGLATYLMPLRDAYSSMETRRIVEFVISKFRTAEDLKAVIPDGLRLAATNDNREAAKVLLETGLLLEGDITRAFMLTISKLFDQVPQEIFTAGQTTRYREGIKDMLRLLRSYITQTAPLKLPANAYRTRFTEEHPERRVVDLPGRRQYIACRRRCALPRYPSVRTMFFVAPKKADLSSFKAYFDTIFAALLSVIPVSWIGADATTHDPPSDDMLTAVRMILKEVLDIDWVVYVQGQDGVGFRSPSERLEILEMSLRLILKGTFKLNLKLAGDRTGMQLLFCVRRKDDDEFDEWESHAWTWIPPFEVGRDAGQLAEWEYFLRELNLESEMSKRGFMVVTEDPIEEES